jgi:hypothetical protein
MAIGTHYRRQQRPEQGVRGYYCAAMDNVYAIQMVYSYCTVHHVCPIHLLVGDDGEGVYRSKLHMGMQPRGLCGIQPG